MPSIRQLNYFAAVARLGSFGRAAEYCGVSQPALSLQIRELEEELGVILIERRPRGLRLTEAGKDASRRSETILGSVRDFVDSARQHGDPLTGVLNIGVIPSIAPYMLPPLLPKLQDRYPNLDLRICEQQTAALMDLLTDGTLDVLFLALPIDHPDIDTHALYEDKFLLVVPASRDVDANARASPDMLCSDNLLLLEEGHCFRDQALSYCALRRIDTSTFDTFGASTLSTIVQMVTAELGITLLPEMSLGMECAHGDVKLLRFDEPEPMRTIGLAWRKTSPRHSDYIALGELIKSARQSGE